MSGVLIVFAKGPRAGLVKTRMCPPLDPEEAARLYCAMLDDVLEATVHMARVLDLEPVVTVYPAEALVEIAQRSPRDFRIVAQRGRDLSERMSWAVAEGAARGATPILIRGSDSPALGFGVVRSAVTALDEADVAIAPDADGGYNLVALREPAPGLFSHPMSTGSVLNDTLTRAAQLGLRTRILEETFDLDTGEDLVLLGARRAAIDGHACQRTLGFLDDHGIWSRLRRQPAVPGRHRR